MRPRTGLPPLLQAAGERRPEPLQYLGSSFGLTQPLLNFWRRAGYQPVYLRQTASDVTGTARCNIGSRGFRASGVAADVSLVPVPDHT